MKSLIRGAGAAAALLALVATNAHAFGPFTNTEVCGGTMFTTCATLTTTYDAGTNTLTIQIANTSGNGDQFTAFGVRTLPAGVTVTSSVVGKTGWAYESQVNSLGGDPDGANPKYTGFGTTNGINNAIANDGNTYTFSLTFSGAVDYTTMEFALHSQGGPNGCSTKLFINGTTAQVNTVSPDCGTTTVPEPITMSLLATGLAGMGGTGLIRRRKQA